MTAQNFVKNTGSLGEIVMGSLGEGDAKNGGLNRFNLKGYSEISHDSSTPIDRMMFNKIDKASIMFTIPVGFYDFTNNTLISTHRMIGHQQIKCACSDIFGE